MSTNAKLTGWLPGLEISRQIVVVALHAQKQIADDFEDKPDQFFNPEVNVVNLICIDKNSRFSTFLDTQKFESTTGY